MNAKLIAKLTPEVLLGAASLGLEQDAQRSLLRITQSRLRGLASGIGSLKTAQISLLEEQTGRTVSELAILGMAQKSSPSRRAKNARLIADTCELVAKFDRLEAKPLNRNHSNGKRPKGQFLTKKRSVA